MVFSTWLRNGDRGAPAARRRAQTSPRQRAGFRPRLEALEDRSLPSALTVTSLQDSGPGSLRAEIAAAQSGDTIVFSSTLFSSPTLSSSSKPGHGKPKPPPTTTPPTITLTSGELNVTRGLTIQGPGAGQLTLSGYKSRVLEVAQNTTVTLSGLTIRNGDGVADSTVAYNSNPWNGRGGGILNHGTLALSGCTVSNNSAYDEGGGVFSDGTLALSGCTVSGNIAYYGGGIWNSGTATLTSSTLSGNQARALVQSYPFFTEGGGIFNHGTLVLSGCTVTGNFSEYEGGGVFSDGTVTARTSTSITGNTISADTASGYAAEDLDNLGVLYLDSTSTIGTLDGNAAILI